MRGESSCLFAKTGTVLGAFDNEIMCFDGPEHQILIGASRSGKGRGHVVPTLLTWPSSALVLDVKGELADGDARVGFPGTAGFREKIGPVLRFAPTRLDSCAFNPLLEVRRGPNEVRDVQNIIEILVDPAGDGRNQDFWNRSAKQVLVGVVLHVLYAEPVARKTLAVVRERLRDLDATAQTMKSTLHRLSPVTGAPETHPEVLHAAESYLAGEERLQSGVKATAESFFGLFADEIIATKTATSDFRIGDLMCGDLPVTLYLQPPPSDATRLMPLLRLLINQMARALMEDQNADAQGRPKRHRLLLVLDEFPTLGRMPFFETMMGSMAGYGLKAFLVCQSLNHITRAYGRDNVILDNCHIITSFAASDGDTAKRIADMAGEVWEIRESETHKRPRPVLGWRCGSTTQREERRPLLLPADVRALPRDEQLIFVAGCKPLRAKKLRFDEESVFRDRLLAAPKAAKAAVRLTTAHDWTDVAALGSIAPQASKCVKAAMKKPLEGQPDLFNQAAARGAATSTAISDKALAGFRDATGAPLAHPDGVTIEGTATEVPPAQFDRPKRAKGI
ncbi:MAG: type IV secretion system protein VirD4 [Alphaproteobacteria bacterium]|nr:MAG: type IV secretion system protein VirD4 [Alphaproteobacteria bacterium]